MPDPEQIHRNYIGLPLRYFLAIAGFSLVVISALFVFPEFFRHSQASVRGSNPEENILGSFPVVVPTVKYGFALDTFQTVEGEVQRGQILGQLLSQYGLSAQGIETLFQRSQGVFRVQDFQTGKPYLLMSKNLDKGLDYLVYEPSLYEYFVFHLKDSLWIEHVERPVETRTQLAEGTIESSLWQAMEANGASPALITKLEDALQWSIDFHHLQQGIISARYTTSNSWRKRRLTQAKSTLRYTGQEARNTTLSITNTGMKKGITTSRAGQ
ncbi:MAG: hypothetical protein IPK21_11045 [Haliscomenobacter sp.]|nr:hypothetical protein [Haliscomenobacter sp.]